MTAHSSQKKIVQTYMEAFTITDKPAILACLTEDVEWILPGVYHHRGKAAFSKEITNDAFIGSPNITVRRMTEEGDVVVAEGSVTCLQKDGELVSLEFCDVFEFRDGLISKLTSYLQRV